MKNVFWPLDKSVVEIEDKSIEICEWQNCMIYCKQKIWNCCKTKCFWCDTVGTSLVNKLEIDKFVVSVDTLLLFHQTDFE